MILKGFTSDEGKYYLDKLLTADDNAYELVSRVRQIVKDGDVLRYTLPGLPLCWKCTMKHLGQALGFAAEVEAYPERIVCVIGELGHAYRECPDKVVAESLRNAYLRILDTGCIEDMTPLLQQTVRGWQNYLQEAK